MLRELREEKKLGMQPNDSTVLPPSTLSTASTGFYTSVCFVVGYGEWLNGKWRVAEWREANG